MKHILTIAALLSACASKPAYVKTFDALSKYKQPSDQEAGLTRIDSGVHHRVWKTPHGYSLLIWNDKPQLVDLEFDVPKKIKIHESNKVIREYESLKRLVVNTQDNPVVVETSEP